MSCARPCAQGAFCSTTSADTNPLIGLQAPLYAHAPVSPLRACHTPEHHSQVPTPRELCSGSHEIRDLDLHSRPPGVLRRFAPGRSTGFSVAARKGG